MHKKPGFLPEETRSAPAPLQKTCQNGTNTQLMRILIWQVGIELRN